MTKFKYLILAITSLLAAGVSAQNGTIRGTVIEDSNGEPLFGVTVQIKGTTNGAITDFDGKFSISAPAGTYDLQASFVSFQTVTISGLTVEAGDVTVIDQIRLQEDVELLEEVVVTAEVIRQTESALLTVKRKSVNVIDGISSESFRKIGDSNAGEAAKRVTGVSVEGGKYVYVRGLGDRYTKTTLNGMDIPGLDPDRNSIQIDVFPTNLIDNMVILKTFTPELPADFTGGIVNIETKDFPDQKVLSASFGIDFNPSMHFNSDYLDYEGSGTDWLGFDNGTRDLPSNALSTTLPRPAPVIFNRTPESDQEVFDFVSQFNPTLGAENETSFLNYSLGLTFANQIELSNGHSLGYLFTGNYKSTTTLYDDAFFGEYQNHASEPSILEFQDAFTSQGTLAESNILLGGLAGLAYKTNNSKYRLTFLKLQNGVSRAGQFDLLDDDEGTVGKSGYIANSDNLEYNERSIANAFLNGEHHLKEGKWIIDWRGSSTWSAQEDPDIRKTAFTEVGNPVVLRFSQGAAGLPARLWRELEERNLGAKVDVTNQTSFMGREAKIKFGFGHTFKERDYLILKYDANFDTNITWSGDASEVWTTENIYPNGPLFLVSDFSDPNSNEYNSDINNTAGYISAEFSFSDKLKSIIGVRAENFVQRHSGRDQIAANYIRNRISDGATADEAIEEVRQFAADDDPDNDQGRVLEGDKVLDALDFFPSLNLIYAVSDRQNLRVSYSRTIARPSFKELSFANILDPVSNRIFNGGLFSIGSWDGNLEETFIDNFDIRWELFQDRGQTYSISGFYKSFANPIELVRIGAQLTNYEYQPRNVGDGQVYGVELEVRKALDFIGPEWSINGNITIVESVIEMSDEELGNRQDNARTGEEIEDTRNMAGQAPWIINAGISYNDFDRGLDAGLFYNVKGETLAIVGGQIEPDVFAESFHSLNFNLNKSFGTDQQWAFTLSVSNILNDNLEQFYKRAFSSQEDTGSRELFQRFSPGTSFGLGINYSF